ncbi:MAG: DUF308 domain-containing protein [Bacteroidaceae bacterium]|nr:DUF308 domain-containing protein [Bacteroidaceae bacterium]
MFKNSFLRALVVLGMGIALVMYSQDVARYVVQGIGVLFILPGLITAFGAISKDNNERSVSVMPIIVGGGSVLMGVVLLLFPEYFISILLYILAVLLLVGSTMQIYQLVKMSREGMKSGMIYYVFPVTIFLVGLYILLNPMETASLPFLFVGYAAILYGVVELLTLMRVAYFNRKAQMMAEQEVKNATVIEEQHSDIVEAETSEKTEKL